MRLQDIPAGSGGDGGLFLRFDDGQQHALVIVGDIEKRETHWTGARIETCLGSGCPHCAEFGKPGVKYLTNVWNIESASVMIWEFSWTTAKELQGEVKDAGWPIYPKLRVKRRGTGKDTAYRVICDGEEGDPERLEMLEDVKLHDLTEYTQPGVGQRVPAGTPTSGNSNPMGGAASGADKDIPF